MKLILLNYTFILQRWAWWDLGTPKAPAALSQYRVFTGKFAISMPLLAQARDQLLSNKPNAWFKHSFRSASW